MPILEERTLLCDECGDRFLTVNKVGNWKLYSFCTPYCERMWVVEQLARLDAQLEQRKKEQ